MSALKQKWRPALDDSVPKIIRESLRYLFDRLYEGEERLSPTSVFKRGDAQEFTISTERQNVPGCQINLTHAGRWTVIGTFCIVIDGAGDDGKLFSGTLFVQGETEICEARLKGPDGLALTVAQVWNIQANRNDTVKLQIAKEADATGTSVVKGEHCSITALWEGVE